MVLQLKTDNQTIINDVNFEYTIFIDDINKAVIALSGNSELQRTLLAIGNKISIYRDNVLDFKGVINSSGNIEGNSKKLLLRGEEEEYVKDKCDTSVLGTSGVWKNTASATILTSILNTGVLYSAGTINAGANIDFRVSNSDSKWNAISNALNKTGQYKFVDYINQEIDVLTTIGSSNVDTLNEGTDFDFLYYQESEAKAKKIIVYGKGDGENQITATATSAGYTAGVDNTRTINDPTIISTSEAQQRANIELSRDEQSVKVYTIPIKNPFKTYGIGDTLTVNGPSYGIENDTVKIVAITRGRKGNNEFLNIEVTNSEFAQTLSSSKQKLAQQASENRNKQTYMQGSGNTLTFGNQINANSTVPLTIPFQLPDNFIKDEAGNIRVTSMTLDYDVDPYRKGVGGATFDGSDPQVQNISGSDAPAVSGTGGSNTLRTTFVGTKSLTKNSGTSTPFTYFIMAAPIIPDSPSFAFINIQFTTAGSTGSGTISIEVYNQTAAATVYTDSVGVSSDVNVNFNNPTTDASINIGEGDWLEFKITGLNPGAYLTNATMTVTLEKDHTHSAGSLAAANHSHTDGSYDINASDINNISIGDSVSDAGSLNATSVNLYLDYWNGSSWVNKHSILSTALTLDTDVDITNGGTYPDASGFWRVRVFTNSANPDLVKGIVKLKHNLDN